ncbi:glycosyltransferase [Aestuariirhabdus sp. LZHN29]|uniref:glycosyltransferase n=1 Tax=Aestuariirhabdus sp. LZHN29 TaxID=3417462 RepID=UPI003CEBE07E
MNPLVSVYIPTHNRKRLLKRAISSVLEQSYPNIEIIVCNDGSNDGTRDFLNQLKKQHSNLTVLHSDKPQGACHARNLAIAAARGEFITGLDDDDLFTPHRIADFVSNYDPKYGFLCTSNIIDSPYGKIHTFGKPSIIQFEDIRRKNHVGAHSFIERKRVYPETLYDESLPAWQDYDLWFRLITQYGPALRLDNHSYIIDQQSAKIRISTSSNAYRGYQAFIAKHSELLSDDEQHIHRINDLYHRRVKLGFIESLRIARSIYDLRRLGALYLATRWPRAYMLISKTAIYLHSTSKRTP